MTMAIVMITIHVQKLLPHCFLKRRITIDIKRSKMLIINSVNAITLSRAMSAAMLSSKTVSVNNANKIGLSQFAKG